VTLPAISICATNFFQTKAASDYAVNFIKNFPFSNDTTGINTRPASIKNFDDIKQAFDLPSGNMSFMYRIVMGDLKENVSSKETSDELKKSFGLNRNQLILDCTVGGLGHKCSSEQFVWIFDTNYGNCFRINRYFILICVVFILPRF
jgi:hypothetical protein